MPALLKYGNQFNAIYSSAQRHFQHYMNNHPHIGPVNAQPKCIAGHDYPPICTLPPFLNAALGFGTSNAGMIYVTTQLCPYLLNGVNVAAVYDDLGGCWILP
jgi:hypothetical protein